MANGFDATGCTAVVTGGGSGIGAALCRLLAQAGARSVVVADLDVDAARKVAAAINEMHPECPARALGLDVADEASVQAAVSRIEAATGAIDLWCSNAGIHVGDGLGDTADWHKSLDVNLMGHVNAARFVIPPMTKRGRGHLVITASAAGLLTDFRCAPYAASKHAAVALAEWLSIAHGDDGVKISCVCPEGVRTGMTKPSSLKAGASSNFLEPEDVAREILGAVGIGRFLVLPHPRVAEYEQRRAADRENWLGRMRAAHRRFTQATPSAAAS
jgi:NAD(P)-dependent dehydrogenase (short-subunit alcohol dehydrogenase family)